MNAACAGQLCRDCPYIIAYSMCSQLFMGRPNITHDARGGVGVRSVWNAYGGKGVQLCCVLCTHVDRGLKESIIVSFDSRPNPLFP